MYDIFYETAKLSMKIKKSILLDSFDLSDKWYVDILDEIDPIRRRNIEMSKEDILKKLNKKSHYVVINRKHFEERGEIGFSSNEGNKVYFLFIYMSEKNLNKIVEKYNLEIL